MTFLFPAVDVMVQHVFPKMNVGVGEIFRSNKIFQPSPSGYDPFRLYYDVPVWGGWRELRDPLTEKSALASRCALYNTITTRNHDSDDGDTNCHNCT